MKLPSAPLKFDEIGYWSELKLEIVEKYGAAYTSYGFAYSTVVDLSTGAATSSLRVLSSDSTFTSFIGGLTESQTYYFRAYATNTAGSAYGVIKSFLTGNSTPKRTMLSVPTHSDQLFRLIPISRSD